MRDLLQIIKEAPVEAEIVQAGCRAFVKETTMRVLDLSTMQYIDEGQHISRTVGQTLLFMTPKGAEILSKRLLRGPVAYFDHCIGQLQRRGVVHRTPMPAAGSREHYPLVLDGKMIAEEMAGKAMQKPTELEEEYP